MSAASTVLGTLAPPLRIGRHAIESPVVLAPMAGITNRAFRRLCREFGVGGPASGDCATSLYVSEMITSRALVERNAETMRLIEHDPDEHPRSIQLYSVDPATARAAARMLVTEDRADHIDLNFGCPVPKVTRKGGGSALPWKRDLFRRIVGAVVEEGARRDVPVTVKMRKGIDDDHLTYLDAGLAAAAGGRRGGRPPRADGRAGVLRHRRLGGHPAAQGDRHRGAGPRQRRHLVGGGRPAHGRRDRLRRRRRRPRLPRPAVALRRPRGGLRRLAGPR